MTTDHKSQKYLTLWHAPRGVGNEGSYYYGPEAAIRHYFDSVPYGTDESCRILPRKHRSLGAAKAEAERIRNSEARAYEKAGNYYDVTVVTVPTEEAVTNQS